MKIRGQKNEKGFLDEWLAFVLAVHFECLNRISCLNNHGSVEESERLISPEENFNSRIYTSVRRTWVGV